MPLDRAVPKRILLADDQAGVREAIKLLLSSDHHLVTEAANGKEALELYGIAKHDLVITDYDMPGMNGDELAAAIKRLAPRQPVLMITAYPVRPASPGNPVDLVLHKPFLADELRAAIARLAP